MELERLSRYLTGLKPSAYQTSKYTRFYQINSLQPAHRFDRWLDFAAGWGGAGLLVADAYSGTFFRDALIQRKLMLAVAILECSPPSFQIFDAPRGDACWSYVRLAAASVSGLLVLAVSVILLAPVHLCARIADRVSE